MPKHQINLSPGAVDWLHERKTEGDYFRSGEECAELWRAHGAAVVAEHINEYPGTRPRLWWSYDAPGPRQRIGGIGTPQHERLATGLCLVLGVPSAWICADLLRTYDGMGNPLGVPAVDPANPPMYESETTYLDRHRLLLPGERRRLKPEDFAPESIFDVFGWDANEFR